jgi:hypothetical protein
MTRRALIAPLLLLAASTARGETIYVEYTNVPYRPPGKGFVELYYEGLGAGTATYGGQKIDVGGMGVGMIMRSFRDSSFQTQIGIGYKSRNTAALHVQNAESFPAFDVFLGARLFPRKPLFSMGTVVVRPTLAANGGLNFMGGPFVSATAGFAFSFTDEPDSLLVEFSYRAGEEKGSFYAEPAASYLPDGPEQFVKFSPSWAIRFSISFGPGSSD